MLEHYHMSFLLTTENRNLFYIQSCSRTKSCIMRTAFIPMFRTLSFKDSMTLFLLISNTLIPGCGISGYDWTGTCLHQQQRIFRQVRHDDQALLQHFQSPWRLATTACTPDATFVIHAPEAYFILTLSPNATSLYLSPPTQPLYNYLPQRNLFIPLSSNTTSLQLSPTTQLSYISLLQRNLSQLMLEFRRAPFTAAIYRLFIFYANGHNENVY